MKIIYLILITLILVTTVNAEIILSEFDVGLKIVTNISDGYCSIYLNTDDEDYSYLNLTGHGEYNYNINVDVLNNVGFNETSNYTIEEMFNKIILQEDLRTKLEECEGGRTAILASKNISEFKLSLYQNETDAKNQCQVQLSGKTKDLETCQNDRDKNKSDRDMIGVVAFIGIIAAYIFGGKNKEKEMGKGIKGIRSPTTDYPDHNPKTPGV